MSRLGEWGGDKRYFVHLKEGFWFVGYETASKSFDTVAEFREAEIGPRPDNR